jgi:hypothetical protein
MIKKEIIINEDLDIIDNVETQFIVSNEIQQNSESLILEASYSKRLQLANLYKNN